MNRVRFQPSGLLRRKQKLSAELLRSVELKKRSARRVGRRTAAQLVYGKNERLTRSSSGCDSKCNSLLSVAS